MADDRRARWQSRFLRWSPPSRATGTLKETLTILPTTGPEASFTVVFVAMPGISALHLLIPTCFGTRSEQEVNDCARSPSPGRSCCSVP
jgi:hypothetical protein